MTSTVHTKEARPVAFHPARLWVPFQFLRRGPKGSSNPRKTLSDTSIPPSFLPTAPPASDLKDAIEATHPNHTIHDVVLPSKTKPLHLDATDGVDSSGSSDSSCGHGLTDDESDSNSTSPDGGYQEHPSPETRCSECRSELGTCKCMSVIAVVLPTPASPYRRQLSPIFSTSQKDDASSIHTSDEDQVPDKEGVQVEITQLKQETDSQGVINTKSNEDPRFCDWWGQTHENEGQWDSEVVLQACPEIKPTCTPPSEVEGAPATLQSSDSKMTLTLCNFLGAGSYGKVVSADWEEGYRPVAVKVSHKLFISELDWTEQGLRHLKNELDILKALKLSRECCELGSNFFPELLKSWQDAKNVYFVMEKYMCNLEDLRWVDPNWDATPGDKMLWSAEMILGVQALHRMRILHRDIKPANIFITSSRHIVIGDYGLARAWLDPFYANFPSTSLRARDSPGTLPYLAPEVLTGFYEGLNNVEVRKYANYGFEADIWSLGVTICESWSHNASLFSVEGGENCLESKAVIPSKILDMDIQPAVEKIVGGHPIWHLIFRMLDRNPKTRIGFEEMLAHPVFAHLDWNWVASLDHTPTWDFPDLGPCSRPKHVGDEIGFPSYYRPPENVDETDDKRMKVDRQHFRRAMGAARDWVVEQPTQIAYDTLWRHDFDWTAPEVIAKEEELWDEDD